MPNSSQGICNSRGRKILCSRGRVVKTIYKQLGDNWRQTDTGDLYDEIL
jgi:hypothetical protein